MAQPARREQVVIEVNGAAIVSVVPDEATVPATVSSTEETSDAAREQNAREVARLVAFLKSLGVAEQDILVEDRSLNTRQNAEFSARILREHDLSQPILVTSAFHMERSVLNFSKQGLMVTPYPADYMVSREQKFHYIKLAPSAGSLQGTVTVLQEKLRTFVTRYFE